MLRRKVKERAFGQSGSSSKDEGDNEQELQTYSSKKDRRLGDDSVADEEQCTGAGQRDALSSSWNESERELFETQIVLLQEQLTAAYVQNQELGEEGRLTTQYTLVGAVGNVVRSLSFRVWHTRRSSNSAFPASPVKSGTYERAVMLA